MVLKAIRVQHSVYLKTIQIFTPGTLDWYMKTQFFRQNFLPLNEHIYGQYHLLKQYFNLNQQSIQFLVLSYADSRGIHFLTAYLKAQLKRNSSSKWQLQWNI